MAVGRGLVALLLSLALAARVEKLTGRDFPRGREWAAERPLRGESGASDAPDLPRCHADGSWLLHAALRKRPKAAAILAKSLAGLLAPDDATVCAAAAEVAAVAVAPLYFLADAGFSTVFGLEGDAPKAKLTAEERVARRAAAEQAFLAALEQHAGDVNQRDVWCHAPDYPALRRSPPLLAAVREACAAFGAHVDEAQEDHEWDAHVHALYAAGSIDCVYTSDVSDAVLRLWRRPLGMRTILRGNVAEAAPAIIVEVSTAYTRRDTRGTHVCGSSTVTTLVPTPGFFELGLPDNDVLLDVAAEAGCDYARGVPGIGVLTAFLARMPRNLSAGRYRAKIAAAVARRARALARLERTMEKAGVERQERRRRHHGRLRAARTAVRQAFEPAPLGPAVAGFGGAGTGGAPALEVQYAPATPAWPAARDSVAAVLAQSEPELPVEDRLRGGRARDGTSWRPGAHSGWDSACAATGELRKSMWTPPTTCIPRPLERRRGPATHQARNRSRRRRWRPRRPASSLGRPHGACSQCPMPRHDGGADDEAVRELRAAAVEHKSAARVAAAKRVAVLLRAASRVATKVKGKSTRVSWVGVQPGAGGGDEEEREPDDDIVTETVVNVKDAHNLLLELGSASREASTTSSVKVCRAESDAKASEEELPVESDKRVRDLLRRAGVASAADHAMVLAGLALARLYRTSDGAADVQAADMVAAVEAAVPRNVGSFKGGTTALARRAATAVGVYLNDFYEAKERDEVLQSESTFCESLMHQVIYYHIDVLPVEALAGCTKSIYIAVSRRYAVRNNSDLPIEALKDMIVFSREAAAGLERGHERLPFPRVSGTVKCAIDGEELEDREATLLHSLAERFDAGKRALYAAVEPVAALLRRTVAFYLHRALRGEPPQLRVLPAHVEDTLSGIYGDSSWDALEGDWAAVIDDVVGRAGGEGTSGGNKVKRALEGLLTKRELGAAVERQVESDFKYYKKQKNEFRNPSAEKYHPLARVEQQVDRITAGMLRRLLNRSFTYAATTMQRNAGGSDRYKVFEGGALEAEANMRSVCSNFLRGNSSTFSLRAADGEAGGERTFEVDHAFLWRAELSFITSKIHLASHRSAAIRAGLQTVASRRRYAVKVSVRSRPGVEAAAGASSSAVPPLPARFFVTIPHSGGLSVAKVDKEEQRGADVAAARADAQRLLAARSGAAVAEAEVESLACDIAFARRFTAIDLNVHPFGVGVCGDGRRSYSLDDPRVSRYLHTSFREEDTLRSRIGKLERRKALALQPASSGAAATVVPSQGASAWSGSDEDALRILKVNLTGIFERRRTVVDHYHGRIVYYLVRHYDHIVIPKFDTAAMLSAPNRPFSARTARLMQALAFYRFRCKLEAAAASTGTRLYVIDEAWTSKKCFRCGSVDLALAGKKSYVCRNPACRMHAHRDVNAALNILLRFVSIACLISGVRNELASRGICTDLIPTAWQGFVPCGEPPTYAPAHVQAAEHAQMIVGGRPAAHADSDGGTDDVVMGDAGDSDADDVVMGASVQGSTGGAEDASRSGTAGVLGGASPAVQSRSREAVADEAIDGAVPSDDVDMTSG